MRRHILYGLMIAAFGLLASAPARAMTADEFYTRAAALKAKGMMAIFQKKEIDALVQEVKSVSLAYKADYDKAQPGG
ncbi:MAG: hypothetical protein J7485_14655, partial [Sphingobium sp.]|nr:hypothetical protein [Sphingobium sp.]